MSEVIFDTSMSLDGYMTAAGQTPEEPLGKGGERLHDWAFKGTDADRELLETSMAANGAVIAGRRTYDDSLPWWGGDGPTGSARVPVFVLSHSVPSDVPEGGVYTFVDSVESAHDRAQAASDGKLVVVMGGAATGRAFLDAGLVDELWIHLVPVLFGGGTRMFEDGVAHLTQLENVSALQTPWATHLRFRVPKL